MRWNLQVEGVGGIGFNSRNALRHCIQRKFKLKLNYLYFFEAGTHNDKAKISLLKSRSSFKFLRSLIKEPLVINFY